MNTATLSVKKVRHEIKRRIVQVSRVAQLTPSMVRITLSGPELEGFLSASFDDHVKLFVPANAAEQPMFEDGKLVSPSNPDAAAAVMRDYTPRHYDPQTQQLDIDFVLHHTGPATDWARQAKEGHYLGLGGPRGSFIIPTEFDWHIMIGDETAIPAIGRRLAELPEGKKTIVVIETRMAAARIDFDTHADLDIRWVLAATDTENGVTALEKAARELTLPEGEGYVWAAGEYTAVKNIREYFVNELGLHKSRIRAASYWRQGADATHETFDE